jgi:hypothetical protein
VAAITIVTGILAAFGILVRWPPGVQPILGVVAFIVIAGWIARWPTVDLRRFSFDGLRTPAGRRRVGQLVALGLAAGFVGGLLVAPVATKVAPADRLLVTLKFTAVGLIGSLLVILSSGPATRPTAIDRPSRLVQQGLVYTVASMGAVSLFLVLSISLLQVTSRLESWVRLLPGWGLYSHSGSRSDSHRALLPLLSSASIADRNSVFHSP